MKLLVVGNMTWDKIGDGQVAGGSVLYCSRVYAELGHKVAVHGHISNPAALDPRVDVIRCGDAAARFENIYDESGARRQRVWQGGEAIPPLRDLGSYDLVHVAPVLGEIDLKLWAQSLKEAPQVVAGLQGWLRHVDEDGWVHPENWGDRPTPFDLAALSKEDIEGLESGFVDRLRTGVARVALTDGARGATLYRGKQHIHSPGWSVDAIDPTGAGDVFAAALTHGLFEEHWSEERAAKFACGAAALVVSGQGQKALDSMKARLSELLDE